MKRTLHPARRIGGELEVPGDKSIGHRAALFSILAKDKLTVKNFPRNADCLASLEAARTFGVVVDDKPDQMVLTPPQSITLDPETIIDCGNSGTTARLLAGIASGLEIEVTLTGDESLRGRPMQRIVDPLTQMGAELYADNDCLPLKIKGRKLAPFEYTMPVASAQVKSALLLAGLASSCSVTIRELALTRDHTEIMIGEIGSGIEVRPVKAVKVVDPDDPRRSRMTMPEAFKNEIKLSSGALLNGGLIDIPGDISTAAFFFAAAAISGSTITVRNVGLNPTRTGFLNHLKRIGCSVVVSNRRRQSGEACGDVTVTGGPLKPCRITGENTVALIDEIPIVAVMAAFTKGTTVIRDAAELKVKESDRLRATAENLVEMGIKCGRLEDGLAIEGGTNPSGADFESFGDHRIAMAFSIAALGLVGPSSIDDESVVSVSCPEFYELLSKVAK